MEPVDLRTDRLLLRPFRLEDVDDVYAYAADEEWSRYLLAAPWPYTRGDAEAFVAQAASCDWKARAVFAIEFGGKVIGSLNLVVDRQSQAAELGYSIGRGHWGKGLTLEAATAVIDWAYPTYSLSKIYARAGERNRRSWRVMEKLGMTREALLRSHRVVRGERADEVIYGLLREEWEARASR